MKPTIAHIKFRATIRALREIGFKFYEIEEIFKNAAEELVTEENTGKQEGS